MKSPDYKNIYLDIIEKKYPNKKKKCKSILDKVELTSLDVIRLNQIIFGVKDKETLIFNQKHRFYDRITILEILEYQKRNKLNNIQLATHFKISRNTIAKWKKIF